MFLYSFWYFSNISISQFYPCRIDLCNMFSCHSKISPFDPPKKTGGFGLITWAKDFPERDFWELSIDCMEAVVSLPNRFKSPNKLVFKCQMVFCSNSYSRICLTYWNFIWMYISYVIKYKYPNKFVFWTFKSQRDVFCWGLSSCRPRTYRWTQRVWPRAFDAQEGFSCQRGTTNGGT